MIEVRTLSTWTAVVVCLVLLDLSKHSQGASLLDGSRVQMEGQLMAKLTPHMARDTDGERDATRAGDVEVERRSETGGRQHSLYRMLMAALNGWEDSMVTGAKRNNARPVKPAKPCYWSLVSCY